MLTHNAQRTTRFLMALAFIGTLFVAVSACKKNAVELNPTLQMNAKRTAPPSRAADANRLVFANWNSFDATLQNLSNLSPDSLNIWENQLNFTSVRRYNTAIEADTTIDNPEAHFALPEHELPPTYGSVLNAEGEVQVGDTIFVYKRGYIFGVHAQNSQLLAQVHNSQDSTFADVSRGRFVSKVYKAPNNSTHFGTPYLYEYEHGRHRFRHTFDLMVTQTRRASEPDRVYITPSLRLKLDYRFRNFIGQTFWRPAGELREIDINNFNTTLNIGSQLQANFSMTLPLPISTRVERTISLLPLGSVNYFLYSSIGNTSQVNIVVQGGCLYQVVYSHFNRNLNLFEGLAISGNRNACWLNLTEVRTRIPAWDITIPLIR